MARHCIGLNSWRIPAAYLKYPDFRLLAANGNRRSIAAGHVSRQLPFNAVLTRVPARQCPMM